MESGAYHVPVMRAEVGAWMGAGPEQLIVDGTLGGGGHSEVFLESGARVVGIDRDPEALAHARTRFACYGNRFSGWEGNFARFGEIPEIRQGEKADGLLLDLGVSSRQLNSPARGFSFMREGPLDMRMGPSSPHTAAEVVNHWDEAMLARILFEFGEEPKARRIAAAIVRQRAVRPFQTTLELGSCIENTVGRHGRTHPATRTFQAIRMAVNEELESLAAALAAAPTVLKPGGRILVITFHSLEDRMVKRFLRHRSALFVDDSGWPEPRPIPTSRPQGDHPKPSRNHPEPASPQCEAAGCPPHRIHTMNHRRNEFRIFGTLIFGTVVCAAISAAGGMLQSHYKNRQVTVTRETEATHTRTERDRFDISSTEMRMEQILNCFVVRKQLLANGSTMLPISTANLEDIEPATQVKRTVASTAP